MSYDESVLNEVNIRNYAQKVARELIRQFNTEDKWIDVPATEDVWVDEVVKEPRWFGLREVEVKRRVKQSRQVMKRVRATPPSGWVLDSHTWTGRKKLQKRGDYGEETYRTTYWLRSSGQLETNDYFNYDGILDGRYFQGSQTDEWRPMAEGDMLWFDRGRRGAVWAPSKGVGLHARLTKLRKTGI